MHVGVDARALSGERTGIGIYTENLARALGALPGWSVTLIAPGKVGEGDFGPSVRVCEDVGLPGTVWVQTRLAGLVRRLGCDVLLGALSVLPWRCAVPGVPVVHDLTALTHPQWHRPKVVAGVVPWLARTLERAARVIAVSRATAEALALHFPDCRPRLRVVPHGVDPRFRPAADPAEAEEVRARLSGGRPFVLYLGTREPRKNLERLVGACEAIWATRPDFPDLVLAGGRGWKSSGLSARLAASPFRSRIHVASYVPAREAPALYRAAEIFCYPSLAEGFGLPVLEALACGAPAVVSDAPALLEVAGGAALAFPAADQDALAAALGRVWSDGALRRRLAEAGPERAAQFSWERAASETAAVLAEAVSA